MQIHINNNTVIVIVEHESGYTRHKFEMSCEAAANNLASDLATSAYSRKLWLGI